jgi:hypothetical protein
VSLLVVSLVSYSTRRAFAIFLIIVINAIILFAVLSSGFFLFATGYYIFLFCIMFAKAI